MGHENRRYDDTWPVPKTDGPILALIPAHDEGPRIGAVVEAASRHLPVVVIDDGSHDDTADRALSSVVPITETQAITGWWRAAMARSISSSAPVSMRKRESTGTCTSWALPIPSARQIFSHE